MSREQPLIVRAGALTMSGVSLAALDRAAADTSNAGREKVVGISDLSRAHRRAAAA